MKRDEGEVERKDEVKEIVNPKIHSSGGGDCVCVHVRMCVCMCVSVCVYKQLLTALIFSQLCFGS